MFFKRRPAAPSADVPSADAPSDEAELLRRYRATGELALLGALYAPRMELVFAVCYRYLRDEEESKDAVMHIFEQLVTDLRRHEVTNFASWLHSVARNHCLMALRRRRVLAGREDLPDEAVVEFEPEPHPTDEDGYWHERLDQLDACLQALPPEQHAAVTLFFRHEKSYQEISETTGYALHQVKSYLQNGRRNLKNCLEKKRG
jgi:RNA polymerase sigma factor (sigma-70 family)